MVLETSPGMKAVSLVQRGKEGAWHPEEDLCQSATETVEAIFVLFIYFIWGPQPRGKGQRAVPRWQDFPVMVSTELGGTGDLLLPGP